jgi:zinc transport system ATP-binding protein
MRRLQFLNKFAVTPATMLKIPLHSETPGTDETAWDMALGKEQSLVAAKDISLIYGEKQILDKVSLNIHPFEIVTLIGPNGAGKTTLARIVLGIARPTSGSVTRRPGLQTGYVPQRFAVESIIPLTVERFMHMAKLPAGAIMEALAETGADYLLKAQLSQLSGGEFQRVLLARALALSPHLLVLDEPVQAVDFAGAARLYELIDTIRRKRGCGVLLISHDLHVVLGASDRVICLNRHVCCEGVPETVAGHPEYVRLFGRDASASFGVYKHRHDHEHSLSGEPKELHARQRAHHRAG